MDSIRQEDLTLEEGLSEEESNSNDSLDYGPLDYFGFGVGQRTFRPNLLNAPEDAYDHLIDMYGQRRLSYESDTLNALAGTIQLIGKSFWGLPLRAFHSALLWNIMADHDPETQRSGFPSWCWAAWRHSGQEMLPTRTVLQSPIAFYDAEGILLAAPIESRHTPKPLSYALKVLPARELSINDPPRSHLIRFFTQCLHLEVDDEGLPWADDRSDWLAKHVQRPDQLYFYARCPETKSIIGKIRLSVQWRRSRPKLMEFVCMSYSFSDEDYSSRSVHVLLIERKDGIAFRVQVSDDPWSEDLWQKARPGGRLVTLA